MSLNLTATLYHTVFFWLKNPNNKKDRFEFENAIKKLIRNNGPFRWIERSIN